MDTKLRVVFAGGGTAGHLYPAINLAETLKRYWPCDFLFFGTKSGIEAERIPQLGYKLEVLNVMGFHRRFSLQNLLFPFRLISSLQKSKKILRSFKPHFVIGTGGYIMGPVLRIAAKLHVPFFLQEQNSFPGLTTRMLAKEAVTVFLAYEEAKTYLHTNAVTQMIGNPISVAKIEKTRDEICKEFGLKPDKRTILVFGGSQGSANINMAMQDILDKYELQDDLQILWQTGKKQHGIYSNWLSRKKLKNVVLLPFINEMWSAYKISEFCICRAGAMSISELAAAKLPAILIPLPSAAGNHQFKNAQTMVMKKCAALVEDNQNLMESLYQKMTSWIIDSEALNEMRKNLGVIAQPDAANKIVRKMEALLKNKNQWPNLENIVNEPANQN